MKHDYRLGLTFRRRGEPIFTSIEIKSEYCDSRDELKLQLNEYLDAVIDDDEEKEDEEDAAN